MAKPTDEQIIAEAKSWKGTKWMNCVAVKGYRVDCAYFIISLGKTFGWIPQEYIPPKYSQDYAMHNEESLLLKEVAKFCDPVDYSDIKVGDILLFNYGKCASHTGIYIGDGMMTHCEIRNGVEEKPVERYKDKFNSVWRPKI